MLRARQRRIETRIGLLLLAGLMAGAGVAGAGQDAGAPDAEQVGLAGPRAGITDRLWNSSTSDCEWCTGRSER
ncbi:hypothetical protein [Micromonospora marina]|uniref:hypothetical protein n=1 Tax=Micromonospora marina TaxID=307120 RepID=UPI003454C7CE